ncbi:MAG: hypothetical protein ACK4JB_05505 [Reyranella sp.]
MVSSGKHAPNLWDRRIVLLAILPSLFLSTAPVSAKSVEHGSDFVRLMDNAIKDLAPKAGSMGDFLGKLSDHLQNSLPSSMVDDKALDQLSKDVEALNKIATKPLPDLNSREALREIGSGGTGTVTGATVELDRLKQASEQRKEDIARLKSARDQLKDVRDTYAAAADRAEKLASSVEKLAGEPTVEFFARMTGRSFVLSWIDLQLYLIPALRERVAAADAALVRLNRVVVAAEGDLKSFDEARAFASAIFSDLPQPAPREGSFSPGANGVAAAQLADIERQMREGTQKAKELAAMLEREANDIRKHNAGLAKIQALTSIIAAGANVASGSGGTAQRGSTAGAASPPAQMGVPAGAGRIRIIDLKTEGTWRTQSAGDASIRQP